MYKGESVGVVVPAYNEAGLVGDVIETLPPFVDRAYVIDDCSTDGTWSEIENAAAEINERPAVIEPREIHADGGKVFTPRVITIRHEHNRGVGGAIKTGYKRAREDGLDIVAVMNGDGQMDPGILDRIIDPIVEGRADYTKGNRLSHPDHRREMSAWRTFGNTLLTVLTKFVSGYWRMNDPQNGYTAISRRALETIDLDRLYDRYGFCNDLLVHLNVHEMRIEDVDMEARYGEETSHISYSSFVPRLSWLLFRRACWRYTQKYVVTDFHPLIFLLVLGSVGTGVGSLVAGWALFVAGFDVVSLLLVFLTLLVSGLFVVLALIFDRLANERLQRGAVDPLGGDEP